MHQLINAQATHEGRSRGAMDQTTVGIPWGEGAESIYMPESVLS